METIIQLIVSAIAIGITAYLLPSVTVTWLGALIAAIVLGIVNVLIKPLLVILTLPINVLTLGLFTLVINALLVMLVSAIVPGFKVRGFWSAFVFAIVLAIINWIFGMVF